MLAKEKKKAKRQDAAEQHDTSPEEQVFFSGFEDSSDAQSYGVADERADGYFEYVEVKDEPASPDGDDVYDWHQQVGDQPDDDYDLHQQVEDQPDDDENDTHQQVEDQPYDDENDLHQQVENQPDDEDDDLVFPQTPNDDIINQPPQTPPDDEHEPPPQTPTDDEHDDVNDDEKFKKGTRIMMESIGEPEYFGVTHDEMGQLLDDDDGVGGGYDLARAPWRNKGDMTVGRTSQRGYTHHLPRNAKV